MASKSSDSSDSGKSGGSDHKEVVAKARGRKDGFAIGSDRAIASPPNWDAQDSVSLYNSVINDNDPAGVDAVGRLWANHGKELAQASEALYDAIAELGDVWIGEGAGAAQGALVAVANSSSQAGEAASSMGERVTHQAHAAAEVKKMPAPKNFDPGRQLTAMLAGGPAAMVADLKAQDDEAKSVKAQQIQFLNAYTQAMSEVDGSTPSFAPDSLGLKSSVTGSAPSVSGIGGIAVGAIPDALSGARADLVAGQVGGEAKATATSGTSAPGAGSGGSSGGGGHGQGIGIAAGAVGAGVLAGGLGVAGMRKLGAGNRSGSKAAKKHDGSETDATADARRGPAGPAPSGGQSVVSPNGTISGGAFGQQGMPPAMPMGGVPPHAAGDKDDEHQRASYLIQPDPDSTFGANEATPPPVIGMDTWRDKDDQ